MSLMTPPKSLTTITPLSKILAAVLFVILPFLGFYLGMEYQKAVTPDLSEATTPINHTPTNPSTDPTANWKTYTANGYSFQYPKDWEVKEDSKNLNPAGISSYLSIVSPEYTNYDMYNNAYLLSPFAGGIIEVYSDYRRPEETIGDLTARLPIDISLKDSLSQNKDIKAGYSGTSYTNTAKLVGVGSSNQQGFWFITKTKDYDSAIDIRLTIDNDKIIDEETKNSYRDVYEHFLSTFKFLDLKQTNIQESDITKCEANTDCIIVKYSSCCGATKKAINKKYLEEYNSHKEWQSFQDEKTCAVIGRYPDDSNVTDASCIDNQCNLKF